MKRWEERRYTEARIAGRDHEHKAVGHRDKRTGRERGDNGRAARN